MKKIILIFLVVIMALFAVPVIKNFSSVISDSNSDNIGNSQNNNKEPGEDNTGDSNDEGIPAPERVVIEEGLVYTYEPLHDYYICSGFSESSMNETVTEVEILNEINSVPVKEIASNAFGEAEASFTKVIIPDNIEKIGFGAFNCCFSLSECDMGSGVKVIGENAFFACGFSQISLPENLEEIGPSSFACCNLLTAVTIPANVDYIGESAFGDCLNLASVQFDETPHLSRLTKISAFAFVNTSISEISLPSSVVTIEMSAFEYCTSLTKVELRRHLVSIREAAFKGCICIEDVSYTGSESEWNDIVILEDNECLTNATISFALPDVDFGDGEYDPVG